MHIVVAVVDDICLKARRRDSLHVHRYKGEIGVELVTAASFLCESLEGDGTVGRVVVEVVVRYLDAFLLYLSCNNLRRVVVLVVVHDHDIVNWCWNLESVLILHQYNIVSLEASDDTAAHFTYEFHFISFFHILYFFVRRLSHIS